MSACVCVLVFVCGFPPCVPQRAMNETLRETRRLMKLEAQKQQMREEAKAQLADRGRFDVLDSILRPEEPVKAKRKKPKPRPASPAAPSGLDTLESVAEPPILLRANAPPKKVRWCWVVVVVVVVVESCIVWLWGLGASLADQFRAAAPRAADAIPCDHHKIVASLPYCTVITTRSAVAFPIAR